MGTDTNKRSKSVMISAAFLLATSSIGPSFMTQTAQFTAQYGASFVFAIVCVIMMDIIAQTNIWSIIGVSGLRGQEIANKVLPGLGNFLICLVSTGGFFFNIGTVGGMSLGLNALCGLNQKVGAALCGLLAICVFLSKNANAIVDKIAKALGGLIIVIMVAICFISKPPVGQVAVRLFTPENPGGMFFSMITMLGTCCGGYIAFAGPHRLLDENYGGAEGDLQHFRKTAWTGISVSGSVRMLIYLCALGVCTVGGTFVAENATAIATASNPAAEVFRLAAGNIGYRVFGLALFAASLTSAIGTTYTSTTFLKGLHPFVARHDRWFSCGLILIPTLILSFIGRAKEGVLLGGVANGLILPISLSCMLLACRNKKIVGDNYKHPLWLQLLGWIVVCCAAYLAVLSFPSLLALFK